ncbi:MAG: hypothetical protein JWN17_769 [Frankiales bacterium]|nr:hypothetical protein [Frankiales bacterium]
MARPEGDERRGAAGERRAAGADRRRYNTRAAPDGVPPYFQVFERIAVALEAIAAELPAREVRLPDTVEGPVRSRSGR